MEQGLYQSGALKTGQWGRAKKDISKITEYLRDKGVE